MFVMVAMLPHSNLSVVPGSHRCKKNRFFQFYSSLYRPLKGRLHARQKNLGPDPSKKPYGLITFVKKHCSFHRAIGAYGPAETPVFLYKSYESVRLF